MDLRPIARRRIALALAISLLATAPIASAEPEAERVHFAAGASSATLKGSLAGTAVSGRDYLLAAKAGQTLTVEVTSKSPVVYYNVMPPSGGEALVNSSTTGESKWSGTLPVDGDYTVQVYFMRSAARQGRQADYTLHLSIPQKEDPE